jgi:hypothetical protein
MAGDDKYNCAGDDSGKLRAERNRQSKKEANERKLLAKEIAKELYELQQPKVWFGPR